MARTTEQDRVRELQRALYRAAKADPGRRFHALYDKVHRRDVLERAWASVRAKRGAAGIDRVTLAQVERYGIDRLLDELAADVRAESYRPLPTRRVLIPKPGSTEQRPLSIPAVRDRIVQAALKAVIEPIFEADFEPCSFGFRPRKSAHDALQVLIDQAWRGARWVAETDIASCFESIPHDRLVAAIEERICDRKLLKLVRAMLRAGVMEQGAVRRSVTGTPQGGVVSPLLANVYLHRLDRETGGRAGAACWCATQTICWCCARQRPRPSAPLRRSEPFWLSWAWSSRRPRHGSCIYVKEARGSISSVSITAGCAPAAHMSDTSLSSPAGPHGEQCSTPATVSVS